MPVQITEDLLRKVFKLSSERKLDFEVQKVAHPETKEEVDAIDGITIDDKPIDLLIGQTNRENTVILMTPQDYFVDLIKLTPEFDQYYFSIKDDGFKNEYKYQKGDLRKKIIEEKSPPDSPSLNLINILFDSQTGEMISSIYIDRFVSPMGHPWVYFWCLCTNPKYYRQGYAESFVRYLINYMNMISTPNVGSPVYAACAYVWNTPSIDLFMKKLGFSFSHVINSDETEKDKSRLDLKKYTFNDVEYTEDQQIAMVLNPLANVEKEINQLKINSDHQEYQEIKKENV